MNLLIDVLSVMFHKYYLTYGEYVKNWISWVGKLFIILFLLSGVYFCINCSCIFCNCNWTTFYFFFKLSKLILNNDYIIFFIFWIISISRIEKIKKSRCRVCIYWDLMVMVLAIANPLYIEVMMYSPAIRLMLSLAVPFSSVSRS